MDPKLAGKDYLDQFITGFTALISRGLENLFGPGVNTLLFGGVTWADLGAVLCLVLFILLVNAMAVAFFRHKSRQSTMAEGKQLHRHVFGALGKPLYVLIWIYGIYLAVMPLILKLPPDEGLHVARVFFDKLFDLGVFAVVFWLFFRFTHVLEARLAILAAKTDSKLDDLFVPLVGKSLRVIVPVVGIIFALPLLNLPAEYTGHPRQRHQHPADRGRGHHPLSGRGHW